MSGARSGVAQGKFGGLQMVSSKEGTVDSVADTDFHQSGAPWRSQVTEGAVLMDVPMSPVRPGGKA